MKEPMPPKRYDLIALIAGVSIEERTAKMFFPYLSLYIVLAEDEKKLVMLEYSANMFFFFAQTSEQSM